MVNCCACSGDLYCCRKVNDENKYTFLGEHGLLFFCWSIGAGALIVGRCVFG